MAFVPDTVRYPDRYNGIGTWGGYEGDGSLQYTTDYLYWGYCDTWLSLGDVKTIDVSGDFNMTLHSHTDIDHAVYYPLLEFDNGFKMGVYLFEVEVTHRNAAQEDVTQWCLNGGGYAEYNGIKYYSEGISGKPHFSGLLGFGTATGIWCREDLAITYGIKCLFLTDYASGQGVTVEGESQPTNFVINILRPYQSVTDMAGFQSFASVSGHTLRFTSKLEGFNEGWISNPQYLWYGYSAVENGIGTIFAIDNATDFLNRVEEIAGDIGGDPLPVGGGGAPTPPQEDVPPSGPGGGDGDMDDDSDPIPFPTLPSNGALSSGAIKAFHVTPAIMTAVFSKLWSTSLFDIDNLQKLTQAPLDNIISLQCIPITPATGSANNIKLGNYDTEQGAPVITQEFYTIDCGSHTVEKYWGSALDYQPYTRVSIYLPFIGIKPLDTDDVMGKTLHVKYNYSIFDGNLTAQIMCGQSVLYKFNGNVKLTIPVTAQVSDALQRAISGVAGGATAFAGGAAAGIAGVAISTAVNVAMAKTQVERSGNLAGSTGLLDDFIPYLIIHRPVQSLADGFRTFKGYPSNISSILGSVSGYTEVDYIHLTGINGATDTELDEIEKLLKSGVII